NCATGVGNRARRSRPSARATCFCPPKRTERDHSVATDREVVSALTTESPDLGVAVEETLNDSPVRGPHEEVSGRESADQMPIGPVKGPIGARRTSAAST